MNQQKESPWGNPPNDPPVIHLPDQRGDPVEVEFGDAGCHVPVARLAVIAPIEGESPMPANVAVVVGDRIIASMPVEEIKEAAKMLDEIAVAVKRNHYSQES